MTGRRAALVLGAAAVVAALGTARPAWGQDIGHKLLGSVGLDAATQPDPGVYVADRLVIYQASTLRDRNGDEVPVDGFELDATANAIGFAATLALPWEDTYANFSLAVPFLSASVKSDRPEASLDRSGISDLFLEPLRLGWRGRRVTLMTGYALYVPTERFGRGEKGGISKGQLSHQLSVGARVTGDLGGGDGGWKWFAGTLASYELNHRKWGVDITRGDSVQAQGGAGLKVAGIVDVGVAGYALWQVTDDQGSDLPAALRGARDRVFGLGPEIAVPIPWWGGVVRARCEWDLGVESRPQGRILVLGLSLLGAEP